VKDSKQAGVANSANRLFWIVVVSIFVGETLVMFLLDALPALPTLYETLLDSTLLLVLMFPVLYLFVLRPATNSIAELQQAQVALRESEARFRSLTELSSDWYWEQDRELRITSHSSGFARHSGTTSDKLVGKRRWEEPDRFPLSGTWEEHRATLEAHRPFTDFEYVRIGDDGKQTYVSLSGEPIYDAAGHFSGYRGIGSNITKRKQTEEKLQLAASVFTHAREGIFVTNAEGDILDVNDSFSRITGYGRDEILGCNPRVLKSGRQEKEFYVDMWRELIDKGHWGGEIWNRRKTGEVYAEMLTISAVRDAQGRTRWYVALFSDITPLKEHQRQLEHIAHYDALTALPNRVLLADRLQQSMIQGLRRGRPLAVAYLDLDGFKAINDNHGHDAGDQLLIAVAARMEQVLRKGDTLARLGGDEFVAVLLDLADIQTSEPILARLLEAAAEPVHAGDLILQVSVSLGVTFYPQAEDVGADQLLRQADQAMYQAKLAGKNRYHVFDADQDRGVRGRHESLERIRQALSEREIPPPLDPHQSPLGAWLDAEGQARYGAQPAFAAIKLWHRQVHMLAAEMCELHSRGRNLDALASLGELHRLRDALLGQLTRLEKDTRG
jgi:diguanylate cyclase (GGDEF)-like protein/PAS domain S-box-containing protein